MDEKKEASPQNVGCIIAVIGAIIASIGVSLMTGCANIITRTDCDAWATAPYQCTCEVAEAIAAPFVRPSGPEGGIGQAICTVILPISIISLPFDAAIDTAFLPWDLYCRKEAK